MQELNHRREILEHKINKNKWEVGVELGVLKGDTYLYLLEHCLSLKHLYGVDTWEYSESENLPYEEFVREKAKKYGDRAVFTKEKTAAAAKDFTDGKMDFIFIDADHSYKSVAADIEAWLPKIKKGGWMMGHDYEHPRFPGVKQAVLEVFGVVETFDDFVWGTKI